ncbi:hypothetical protein PF005_g24436 [Phytophthora fragariae]|uniref:Uncharacterized protein n=2 Tax=Phytophthora TaxID=4783 RepID=A0A6A3RG42_9STRA|nr:hypothetical protein PF003_g22977 [Phytophthora fragariae]KAE9035797.1 hypothetical protein PR002_g7389 [Phytophthora rubi]KAE8924631.1 hypothetical protein PF009_g25137 [Phytophthora fragariae]KAE8978566.1 hypothetical protein PF011_g23188 [Phytophthora fragariae]KAE9041247.1 hypothetical protein PR001_g6706 [Phytophthora rubi]
MSAVSVESSSLPSDSQNRRAAVDQNLLDGTEYAEVATIDQFPRGTALHAARTALIKESARAATLSKPPTRNETVPEVKLAHSDSTSSTFNSSSNPEDTSSASDTVVSEETPNNEPPRAVSNGADLARRAARRVNVWKKSEQERRGEEERARHVKQEQEKKRQNHAAHAKQRRRAEIYALNALLRQLQQEKVSRYIAAQKQIQELQQQQQQQPEHCKDGGNLAETTAALVQVRAVGV